MRRHPTIQRTPLTILRRWDEWGRRRKAASLFFKLKEEAEAFLEFLRGRGIVENSQHRYMVCFREICLYAALIGRRPRDFDYRDWLAALQHTNSKGPTCAKLYLKYLIYLTEDQLSGARGRKRRKVEERLQHYERLYKKIKVPTGERRLPEVLSEEQVRRLIDECGRISFELKVLVELVYETGARVGEVLQLRRGDVVFDEVGARVYIRRSKSEARTVRVVLFAPDLARLCEGKRPEDYLFSRNYNTYLKWLRKAWRKAGLPEPEDKGRGGRRGAGLKRFHILRHTRATELYGRMSEKEMMIWFGWKTRSMVDVYAKVKPEQVENKYLEIVGAREEREKQQYLACPRCGHPNFKAARFCNRCGFPLTSEELERARLRELEMERRLERIEKLLEKIVGEKTITDISQVGRTFP